MTGRVLRGLRKAAATVLPGLANRIMYCAVMKRPLRMKPPRTFNEKVNWLKLNAYPRDARVVQCADKIAVREYVAQKGYGHLLNDCIGVWLDSRDIDWDALPQQFALKCSHGCGYNIICADKSRLDRRAAVRRLNRWLAEDFSKVTCEPHYAKIPRRILCERFLGTEIANYKFFCFDGMPRFFYVSRNVDEDFRRAQVCFFAMDGTPMNLRMANHQGFAQPPQLPENLPEMIETAGALAADFPFVRVDLFSVSGKIYFSELTFTPSAGMIPFEPREADMEIGRYLDLGGYGK